MFERKKIIGILTIEERYLLSNYGSFFQHWALRAVIRKLGYDVFRYAREYEKGALLGGLSFVWHVWVRPRIGALIKRRNWRALDVRVLCSQWNAYRAFSDCFKKVIGLYRECAPHIDVAIVGGDQPWNSDKNDIFLEQVPKDVKKISYAVSADWTKCSEDFRWCERVKKQLPTFQGVSVRERVGSTVLHGLVPEIEVTTCLDPVLLLSKEDFTDLVPPTRRFSERTLLFYGVNIKTGGDKCADVLQKIASALNCKLEIIAVQGSELSIPCKQVIHPSPIEFIQCIRDAAYIVTNSFHGIAFSVLFEKQFVFLPQAKVQTENANCRQTEFLQMMDLSEKILQWTQDVSFIASRLNEEIDWVALSILIDQARSSSLQWLKYHLECNCE